MVTLFTLPKAFSGHTAIIQRNAFASWKLLQPEVEIIILGDDDGVAETATEFGFKHIPVVRELQWRKVLHPPELRPRYMGEPHLQNRLEQLININSITDVVTRRNQ